MSKPIYEIRTSTITLKLTIEEVERLHIHEEIIPSMLRKLVESIRDDGVFKDPVIVDEKSLVVLDGMHRVAAAKELGLRYIPVCLVDYDNPNIRLYSWTRVFRSKKKTGKGIEDYASVVTDIIGKLGHRHVSVPSLETGEEMLARRELIALVVLEKAYLGVRSRVKDIKTIYDEIKRLEDAFATRGYHVEYHTESDAIKMAETGDAVASFIPPTITKAEVRSVALSGLVFVHKATRHVIPARPMNVSIPLEYLTGKYSIEDATREFIEFISRKKLKVLPPGTILDRRYEEEIYFFE